MTHEPPKPDEHTGPPGPVVRWVTITQEYDRNDRLISERVTETYDRQLGHPEPHRSTGYYL